MELKAIIKDIESGLTDDDIMSRHHLSEEQLVIIYNALDKVNELTKRILAKKPAWDSDTSFYALYERFNVGPADREEIDQQLQHLRGGTEGRH